MDSRVNAFTQNASHYKARGERGGQNAFYVPEPFQPLEHIFTQRTTSAQTETVLYTYLFRRDRLPSLRSKRKDCSRKLLRFDSSWCI